MLKATTAVPQQLVPQAAVGYFHSVHEATVITMRQISLCGKPWA